MATQLIDQVRLGGFAPNEPWPDVSAHYKMEEALGVTLPVMSWFTTLDSLWLTKQAADAASSGHDIMVCIEPVYAKGRAPIQFQEILDGLWDDRLDKLFRSMATFPNKITLRFAHEMNGNWYPWSVTSATSNTNSLDVWLKTWRYIVARQRAIGGNVKWMFCANSSDTSGVPIESYWPGADFVDVLSIDAYNGYAPWMSARKLIQPMYDRLTALDPVAPVWIAELGCRATVAGETFTKAGWFADLFALTSMPRLSTIVFFNMLKDPTHDWRITTSDVRPVLSTLLQGARQIAR